MSRHPCDAFIQFYIQWNMRIIEQTRIAVPNCIFILNSDVRWQNEVSRQLAFFIFWRKKRIDWEPFGPTIDIPG